MLESSGHMAGCPMVKNSTVIKAYIIQWLFLKVTLRDSIDFLQNPRTLSYDSSIVHLRVSIWVSQVALVVKNLLANTGDVRDAGSIPESGRSPGGGMATHSSILAWRISWTEEPSRLQSTGSQRVRHD